jgi:Fe-S oxidoreductase
MLRASAAEPNGVPATSTITGLECKKQFEIGGIKPDILVGCCGGGGGGMWLETNANTRINHNRLKDALDAKADVIATACPYCMLMFDDAIRSKGLDEQVKVMDVAELMLRQMG